MDALLYVHVAIGNVGKNPQILPGLSGSWSLGNFGWNNEELSSYHQAFGSGCVWSNTVKAVLAGFSQKLGRFSLQSKARLVGGPPTLCIPLEWLGYLEGDFRNRNVYGTRHASGVGLLRGQIALGLGTFWRLWPCL